MKRMTIRNSDWTVSQPTNLNWENVLYRLAAYEDTGLDPEQLMELKSFTQGGIHKVDDGWKHVQDLLQAEKDARLVVLPCKVGATVYGHSKAEVSEYKVAVISLATYNWYLRCQNHNSDFWVTDADIGKTVFLSREEAEAAIAQKGATNEDSGSLLRIPGCDH